MPTDAPAAAAPRRHPVEARRILRLALGTSLALFVGQALGTPVGFIAPILTLLILALPLPAPGLKQGLAFLVALFAPMLAGALLLPVLEHARWAGIVLVTLALYFSFYYTARGGSAVLGNFMTIGLTLVVTIGSVNPSLLLVLVSALAWNALLGLVFVWVAHAVLPEHSAAPARPAPGPAADASMARRSALRSLLVVLPMALAFLFMSGSPSYTVVMLKVATMGQQASSDNSRQMGRALLLSTLWGGLAALAAWVLLRAWPSLIFYTLLVALAVLTMGRGIFRGAGMHAAAPIWSYALVTMLAVLGPSVLDGAMSAGAGAAMWSRLGLFALIALYGTLSVAIFDAFWAAPRRGVQVSEIRLART